MVSKGLGAGIGGVVVVVMVLAGLFIVAEFRQQQNPFEFWANQPTTFMDSTEYYPDEILGRSNEDTIAMCKAMLDTTIEKDRFVDKDINYCEEFLEHVEEKSNG